MFHINMYLYVSIKPLTMIYLFAAQLILFCILIANVGKLLITLIIKNY